MRVSIKTTMFAILLIVPLTLSGCGFNKSSGAIKPDPNKTDLVKKGDKLDNPDKNKESASTAAKAEETTPRELYLLDANGRVSPQVVQLPKTQSLAKQALQYLVKDGPVSDILPNGFQAVIPSGTTIHGVNLKDDGTLVVNFSKDFLNYKANQEKNILQAITWTVTQFDTVKSVQLQIDGKNKSVMPVGKTPIGKGLTRANGINTEIGNVVDVTASDSVTVYYLSENKGNTYYVPVTTRVKSGKDELAAAVNAMIDSPAGKGLQSAFGSDVALKGDPVVKDGVVTLNFNESLYTDPQKKTVSNAAIDCLALTLTGQSDIKKVAIEVDGSTKVMKESGKPITEPVSRPTVNKTGI